jgi:hypothetical protein
MMLVLLSHNKLLVLLQAVRESRAISLTPKPPKGGKYKGKEKHHLDGNNQFVRIEQDLQMHWA